MFLNSDQIKSKIEKGEIIIEPLPDENSFTIFSVILRLGNEFIVESNDFSSSSKINEVSSESIKNLLQRGKSTTIEFGDSIVIHPFTNILTTTTELIRIPWDLLCFVYPKSSLQRFGIQIIPSIVSPGYEGRLIFNISNITNTPFRIYPGQRFLQILFASIEPSNLFTSRYTQSFEAKSSPKIIRKEIDNLKETIHNQEEKLRMDQNQINIIKILLDESLSAKYSIKGKKLEQLSVEIFRNIPGLEIIKTNANLKSEEIDILLQNNINFGFWRFLNSPIIVECKNWNSKVRAAEIGSLIDKMGSISPDVKTGILVSPKGITGNSYKDAMSKVRDYRLKGKYIIILDLKSLQRIASGENASKVIENGYNKLLLI